MKWGQDRIRNFGQFDKLKIKILLYLDAAKNAAIQSIAKNWPMQIIDREI